VGLAAGEADVGEAAVLVVAADTAAGGDADDEGNYDG
jgi:hypothetical protein